jgi:hypothetical protein
MICVCNGQSGLQKTEYLEQVCAEAKASGHEVKVFNIGELMYRAARPSVPRGKILSLPLDKLNLLVERVFTDIVAEVRSGTAPNYILNSHAVFRYRRGLIPGMSFQLLRNIDVDYCVTMIDDFHTVKFNLDIEHPGMYTFGDVLIWREEEILVTKIFAESTGKPFFLIAKKHRPDILSRLLFLPKLRKIYASFPITNIQAMPDVIAAVEQFKADLSRDFVVFDPYTISEKKLDYLAKSAARDNKKFVTVKLESQPRNKWEIPITEIQAVVPQIDQQIISRDLQLIDQSEMVIAYVAAYPNGDPVHSAGTQKEVTYARELGKDVYYIWMPAKEPGPFEKDAATRIFRSVDEAREALSRLA